MSEYRRNRNYAFNSIRALFPDDVFVKLKVPVREWEVSRILRRRDKLALDHLLQFKR